MYKRQPYTFTWYEHAIADDDVVIVVSQSGYSTNAIAALDKIRALGYTGVALTGNVEHDIKAVSYTHLDVYKRQPLDKSSLKTIV